MNRRIWQLIGIALLLFTLLLALWPGRTSPPVAMPPITVTPGNEKAWRQLQLGQLYETNHALDNAQKQYEAAALAEQQEIALAAQQGLERVVEWQAQQSAPWSTLRASLRSFLAWLVRNFFLLVLAVGFLWLVWLLLRRLPHRAGYLALPFEDHTSDKLGQGFHAQLCATLNAARDSYLHGHKALQISSERLDLPLFGVLSASQDAWSSALTNLDNFSAGGINLPLGKVLLSFQPWVGGYRYVISGHLHQHGAIIQLQAELREVTTNTVRYTWTLASDPALSPAAQAAALAEGLAFRLLHAECPALEAHSWRSLQLYSQALTAYGRYGEETFARSILETAAERLATAITLDPGFSLAHFWLGVVNSNLGRYEAARANFRQVAADDSRLVAEARYNLGLAFYHEFAEWANKKAVDHFEFVLGYLDRENRTDEERLLLALSHCGLAAVQAQRLRPGLDPTAKEQLLISVNNHNQEALALSPKETEVAALTSFAWGMASLRAGEREAAIDRLTEAIRIQPGYPNAYVALAEAYETTQPEEARRWLVELLRWQPNYEYAHFRLARICGDQGNMEDAQAHYRRAPSISDAQNRLGEILAQEGELGPALQAFQRAANLNRRSARAWGNLAWWTLVAGKRDEESLLQATGWARRALELNKGTTFEWLSRDTLGWILVQRGLLDPAETELKQSLDLRADKIQNRYHLAYLYKAKGLSYKQKAIQTLGPALKLPESGYWREQALQLMAELKTAGDGGEQ